MHRSWDGGARIAKTQTEHYRPGATCGPARSHGLNPYRLNLDGLRESPQPMAGTPIAPGR